jgi:hypothetical protein
MPRIPRYSSQGSLSGRGGEAVVEHPEQLTAGIKTGQGEVISRFAREGADVINDYLEKKEKARRTIEATNIETKMLLDIEAFQDAEAKNPDIEGADQRIRSFVSSAKPAYLGMVKNDRDKELYGAKIDQQLAHAAIKARNIADKKMMDAGLNDFLTKTLPLYERQAINGDPSAVPNAIQHTELFLKRGLISPAGAAQIITTIGPKTDLARATSLIDNNYAQWASMTIEEKMAFMPHSSATDIHKINIIAKQAQSEKLNQMKLEQHNSAAEILTARYAGGDSDLVTANKIRAGMVNGKIDPFWGGQYIEYMKNLERKEGVELTGEESIAVESAVTRARNGDMSFEELTRIEQKYGKDSANLVKGAWQDFGAFGKKMTAEEKRNETLMKAELKNYKYQIDNIAGISKEQAATLYLQAEEVAQSYRDVNDSPAKFRAWTQTMAPYLRASSKQRKKAFEEAKSYIEKRAKAQYDKAWGEASATEIPKHDKKIEAIFGKDAETAKKIMRAESSGDPMAHNSGGGGTGAFGLFQIRGKLHRDTLKKAGIIKTEQDLYDPDTNIRAAKFLYDRDGWKPWDESKGKWGTSDKMVVTYDPKTGKLK